MIKKNIALVCCTILLYACSKESRTVNKIAGKWQVNSVQLYILNQQNVLVLNSTLVNIGTINLIDENRNFHSTDTDPVTNKIEIALTTNPGSINYLYQYSHNVTWSIEQPKRADAIQLTLGVPGSAGYRFSTYTAELDGNNSLTLLFADSEYKGQPGFDNFDNYKEIWTLQRVD